MANGDNVTPDWPTETQARYSGGRVQNLKGEVWLYRKVPLGTVTDARNERDAEDAAEPLMRALDLLAARTTASVNRRATAKGGYRRVHLLLVNVPARFDPAVDTGISPYLKGMMPTRIVQRRLLLFGVKLQSKLGGGNGWRAAAAATVETLISGGTPLSDFDADRDDIDALLSQAGLSTPSRGDFALAESWWNFGLAPDTPLLEHADHIHVFTHIESMRTAAEQGQQCETWPQLPGHHILSFGTVSEFDLGYTEATSRHAQWVDSLLAADAMAVSIRAAVEPSKITREELRRRKRQWTSDQNERVSSGAMERAELEEKLEQISQMEAWYSGDGARPTLTECSVTFAVDGREPDMASVGQSSGLKLAPMAYLQVKAMRAMMLASRWQASPYLHDVPTQTVAYSALPSLSQVGDTDGERALVGFSERDRQPAWLAPAKAAQEDSIPMMLVAGQAGSGKSMAMVWLADQLARTHNRSGERTPVIIFDPKQTSDFTDAVLRSGGQVYSLDDLLEADGVFDPLRFSKTPTVGVNLSASLLMAVNPFGTRRQDYETALLAALQYGVDNGATCTGQALKIAADAPDAKEITRDLTGKVLEVVAVSPVVRAMVGLEPRGVALSAAEGITLIKVGDAALDLPDPGTPADQLPLAERATLALIRAIVYGSMTALMKRQGVLMLDEAWVVLGTGRSEIERVGRLARSQEVLPMLFTQRVTDALNAGLAGYISRGLILPITDPDEARAACRLFKLEETPTRLARITAPARIGDDDEGAPNWASMRALRDPKTKKVLRGSVGIYVDLRNRAVPVEVAIPPEFLAAASTNPDDMAARSAAKESAARQRVFAAEAVHQELELTGRVHRPATGGVPHS